MSRLPRPASGLLKHPLDRQVLVYDTRVDRVHLLDPTTACVLELLEEGGWTPEGITAEIAVRLDISPKEGLFPLALEELRHAGLLDETVAPATPLVDVNRRELVRKLAMTGTAALLVPTVATLTATRGYAQGTVASLGPGRACTASAQCIHNNCCLGICSNTGCPQPNGAACTTPAQCASLSCANGVCCAGQSPGTSCNGLVVGDCAQAKAQADLQCCSGNCPGICLGSFWDGTCT